MNTSSSQAVFGHSTRMANKIYKLMRDNVNQQFKMCLECISKWETCDNESIYFWQNRKYVSFFVNIWRAINQIKGQRGMILLLPLCVEWGGNLIAWSLNVYSYSCGCSNVNRSIQYFNGNTSMGWVYQLSKLYCPLVYSISIVQCFSKMNYAWNSMGKCALDIHMCNVHMHWQLISVCRLLSDSQPLLWIKRKFALRLHQSINQYNFVIQTNDVIIANMFVYTRTQILQSHDVFKFQSCIW